MHGVATAPVAISLVNAIPAGRGAAAAVDLPLTARVELDARSEAVDGRTADGRPVDTTLIERCVAATTDRFGASEGGRIETTAAVPPSVGLKTSSAAANAAIAATLSALDTWEAVDPLEAATLGVEIAREVGVTATGAFDDAAASMLGGLVVTDNREDTLLDRREPTGHVAIAIPDTRIDSGDVDIEALRSVAPLGHLAADLVAEGTDAVGMAINGLAVAAALSLDTDPLVAAFEHTPAVSYAGTGPAIAAIADRDVVDTVADCWDDRGPVRTTHLRHRGVTVGDRAQAEGPGSSSHSKAE